ncbi:MAG: GntG family PLP-dependent aldolase [Armatimonadia bacterium]
MIDLRSDTKTLPSPEMRQAIANADLGDDVMGEDPTVNALEARCAALLGKEAALLVNGGTMGNLVSIYAQTRPGQELVCHDKAHIYHYERGGFAAVCGLLARPLAGDYGVLSAEDVAGMYGKKDLHRQDIGLVCLENTHNNCGGTCLSAAQTAAVAEVAHSHGTPLHIDGARLFNAAVALGVPARDLAAPADTVTFCFSKGLGAPVGSVVCGPADTIQRAREARKLFGGGMRQSGIIAAGCLYALDHNIDRLAEDHAHARQIAETLAECPGITIDLASVQTNIMYFDVHRDDMTAPHLCRHLESHGIAAGARTDHNIRFVTHLDISQADTDLICEVLRDVLA